MRYHLTPVRMATIKNLKTINSGEGVEKKEPSDTVARHVSWCNHYGEQYGGSSKNLRIKLPYGLAILLLGTYPKKRYNLKRHMYPNVHCSAIYNSQDMEAT